MRRVALAAVAAAASSMLLPNIASAAQAPGPTVAGVANTPEGRLDLSVNLQRFYATASGTKAAGTATATLTPLGQLPTKVSKPVTLAVTRSGTCTILTLT